MEAADPSQPAGGAPKRGLFARLFGRARFEALIPAGQRVYAVGDIHGRLDLFERLLGKIAADNARRPPADVELILLGDVIDRGPDSAALVDRLRAGVEGFDAVTVLRGNHEQAMLQGLAGDLGMFETWLGNGGTEALASWGVPGPILYGEDIPPLLDAAREIVPAGVLPWIAALPLSRHIGDYYFVHAGVRPGVPLAEQQESDQLWIRQGFLDSDEDHGAVIVHGHTIKPRVQQRGNRIGIDTGAWRTGRLTALGLEGDRRWVLTG